MRQSIRIALWVVLGLGTWSQASARAEPGECLPVPEGQVAWWPADGDATDIQGHNHGVLRNGTTFEPGRVMGAFAFDGVDDYVEVPDDNLWAFGSKDFTIDLWILFESLRPSTIVQPQVVFIGNDEGPGPQDKWTFAFGGGVLYWHINGPAVGPIFLVQAPFSPAVGRWYHLAVTRSGTLYAIYVDGLAIGAESNAHPVPDADAPLTIGQAESAGFGQDFFMHGRIDEVQVFDRALLAGQILAIASAGSDGKCRPTTSSRNAGWGEIKAVYR